MLIPRRNHIEVIGSKLYIGKGSVAEAPSGRRVWLVVYGGDPDPTVLAPGHCVIKKEYVKGLSLHLFVDRKELAAKGSACPATVKP